MHSRCANGSPGTPHLPGIWAGGGGWLDLDPGLCHYENRRLAPPAKPASGVRDVCVVPWHKVSQAFSPRLHGFWLNELGIDGALVPLAVKPEDFSTVVRGLMKSGFKGSSVTIPHKEGVATLAKQRDETVLLTHAANTLVRGTDGFSAYNGAIREAIVEIITSVYP